MVPSVDEARFAGALCEGSLTVARQLLRPELRELRSKLYGALSQRDFSGLSLAKTLLESIDSISADTPEQRVHANWLIRFAVEFYRSALQCLSRTEGTTDVGMIPEARTWAHGLANRGEPMELIGALMERSIDATSHIDQNVPVALALETLLDDLAKMSRPVPVR